MGCQDSARRRDSLEHADVPPHVVTTDFIGGEEVLLTTGPALDSILASAAIPGALLRSPGCHGSWWTAGSSKIHRSRMPWLSAPTESWCRPLSGPRRSAARPGGARRRRRRRLAPLRTGWCRISLDTGTTPSSWCCRRPRWAGSCPPISAIPRSWSARARGAGATCSAEIAALSRTGRPRDVADPPAT